MVSWDLFICEKLRELKIVSNPSLDKKTYQKKLDKIIEGEIERLLSGLIDFI